MGEPKTNGGVWIDLREYFLRIFKERDRLYREKFQSASKSQAAALAAVKSETALALSASKEAITKAEQSQQILNDKNNEFRAQLKDQAATLTPRTEVDAKIKGVEDRIGSSQTLHDKDIGNLHDEIKVLRQDITSLRESRSQNIGKDSAQHDTRQQSNWSTGTIIQIVISLVGWAVAIIFFLNNKK